MTARGRWARAFRALPLDRRDAPPAALGLLGAGLVLAREATYGVLLHWDSINYVGVARSLAAGDGFAQFNGGTYTVGPPLYPLLLAVPGAAGIDPLGAAGPINATLAGLAIFAGARWLARRLEARWLALWGGLALALAPPLAWMASWAMSEPLFILLTLLALMRAEAYLRGRDASALRQAAALTALACLTRWAGIPLIAAVAALLALQPGVPRTAKARHIAMYAAISAAPIALWMLRNLSLGASATNNEAKPQLPLAETLGTAFEVAGRWLTHGLPWAAPDLAGRALGSVLLLSVAVAVAGILTTGRNDAGEWRNKGAFGLFGAFALGHVLFSAASIALGRADVAQGYRYLSPAFAPLLVAIALALDGLLALARGRWARPAWAGGALAAAVAAPLVLWLAASAPQHASAVREANAEGFGNSYSNARWDRSATLARLRESPDAVRVLSNVPPAAYIHVPRDGRAPRHERLRRGPDAVRDQIGNAADGVLVVWFRDWFIDFGYGAGELRDTPGLETVADLDDGALFRVRRSPFAVRLDGNALIYEREGCASGDTEARFFVHATPADWDDWPQPRPNLNFWFDEHGALEDGRCTAVRPLPPHPLAVVETGQYDEESTRWVVELRPGEDGGR